MLWFVDFVVSVVLAFAILGWVCNLRVCCLVLVYAGLRVVVCFEFRFFFCFSL